MKAIGKFYDKPGLWLKEVDEPKIKSDEVLIKVKFTGICGTDVHIFNWDSWAQQHIKVPLVIGHEFMGVVLEIGEDVKDIKVGDRVSGEGHLICNYCRNCRAGKKHFCRNVVGLGIDYQGGFAEYLALKEKNVFKLSNNISDEIGAIFDPYGNAVHTALSFDVRGEDVLIIGAGPIGIMVAMIAKFSGARFVVISDISDYRLNLAKNSIDGINVVNVKNQSIEDVMKDIGITEGFDVVFEVSGNVNAINSMLNVINFGGKIAALGLLSDKTLIDWNNIVLKGLIVRGIYGRKIFDTWYLASSLIQSGLNLNPIITHKFSALDFKEAFDIIKSGNSGKVILNWNEV